MARFRDSRGRFSSRPRDSSGRYCSVESYNRSQGQKRRRERETAERETAAEWQRRIEREERRPAPAPDLSERQDYFGVQDVPKSEVDSSTKIHATIDLGAGPVYEYDGPPEGFDVREMRRALDEWSEEALGDEAHYWRAPGSRIFKINRYQRLDRSAWDRIEITVQPDVSRLIKDAIAGGGTSEPPPPAVGRSLEPEEEPPELTDEDALPI